MTDVTPDLDDTDVFETADGETHQVPETETWVSLPRTELFETGDADRLLRRKDANVIAIIGERGSGKTTLVSAIYERLLKGRFAQHAFAFSKTLSGFERRSYLSRASSGRAQPSTPRTSARDGLLFFHLSLSKEQDPSAHVDLLISERAGETYRKARDEPVTAKNLIEVEKADYVVFVIDGGRLADPKLAAEVTASVRGLIRVLRDQGLIGTNTHVQVVATKMDLLEKETATAALQQLRVFQTRLSTSFASGFRSFSHFEVTARDPAGLVEVAQGVDALLSAWTTPRTPKIFPDPPLPALVSEFDRLLVRTDFGGVS
jgi:energy-coupling factor transporter ATP-binding protein EcfA2